MKTYMTAQRGNFSISLVGEGAAFSIQAVTSDDNNWAMSFDSYDEALKYYQNSCEAASMTPRIVDLELSPIGMVADLRRHLARNVNKSEYLDQVARDPAFVENRALIRQICSGTTLADATIRALCLRVDKEQKLLKEQAEAARYDNMASFGAF